MLASHSYSFVPITVYQSFPIDVKITEEIGCTVGYTFNKNLNTINEKALSNLSLTSLTS